MKSYGVTIQMKPCQQYFLLALIVFKHFTKWNLGFALNFDFRHSCNNDKWAKRKEITGRYLISDLMCNMVTCLNTTCATCVLEQLLFGRTCPANRKSIFQNCDAIDLCCCFGMIIMRVNIRLWFINSKSNIMCQESKFVKFTWSAVLSILPTSGSREWEKCLSYLI